MFKNLKKKLEQGVAQSTIKGAIASAAKGLLEDKNQDSSDAKQDPVDAKPLAESTPKKSGQGAGNDAGNQSVESENSGYATANQSAADEPAVVPVGQLVDIPLQDSSSESSHVPGDVTPRASRSRTSSISSVTSDSSFFTNVSFPQHHYTLPSDMESEVDESGTDLHTVSKEDLYQYIQKYQRRATRYKGKFIELVAVYKDMVQERDKFKNTLSQSQDRAFRRISELKEQIQLDQKAKQDLEENYNLVIEEKGEFIKVLQMQVKLLKEGKEIPAELEQQMKEGKTKESEEKEKVEGMNSELSSLRDKVKHQDGLLQRCKEIIRSNKEKYIQVVEERDSLQRQLEDNQMELAKLQSVSSPDTISKLQNQIKQAREVIEQLETDRQIAIAEVKQKVHVEMEGKDAELTEIRSQGLVLQEENAALKEKLEKLEKTAAEQLEKSREIIKRLNEEKKKIVHEMEEKLRKTEDDMEVEKERLVQEVSRGKSAAITLMQEQTTKQAENQISAALEERDDVWQQKMSQQEMAHQEIVATKEKEFRNTLTKLQEEHKKLLAEKDQLIRTMQEENKGALQERERDMQLAIEERDLQKMATLSQHDEKLDQLQSKLHAVQKEKTDLETLVNQMQEEHEKQYIQFQNSLKEQKDNENKTLAQLRLENEQYVNEILSQHEKTIHETSENLLDKHAAQIADIIRKHEDKLQSTTEENEKHYKSEMKKMKTNLENMLHEKNQQAEKMSVTLQQLKLELQTKEQDFEQKSIEFKTKMTESNENYKQQISECDKLQQELDKVREEYEQNRSHLEEELSGLYTRFSTISEQRSALETENSELKMQLERLNREVDEKYQNADSKVRDLLNQVNSLEEQKLDLAQEMQKLKDSNNELQMKIDELTQVNLDKENTVQALLSQLADTETDMQNIKALQNETLIEKETAAKLNCEKEEQLKQVDSERVLLKENMVLLQSEVQKVSETFNMKEQELNMEKQSLIEKVTALQSDLDEKIELLRQQELSLSEAETNIQSLKKHVNEKTDFISKCEAELSGMENKVAEHQNVIDDSCKEIVSVKEENSMLKQQLEVLENESTQNLNEIKSALEKENLKCIDFENKLKEEIDSKIALEDSFRIKFEEKQGQFKENIKKMKEKCQDKLKEKDEMFEKKLSDLARQKDTGAEELTKHIESHYQEQIKLLEEKQSQNALNINKEWEQKIERLTEAHLVTKDQLQSQVDKLMEEKEEIEKTCALDKASLLEEKEKTENELKELFEDGIKKKQVQLDELSAKLQDNESRMNALSIERDEILSNSELSTKHNSEKIAEFEQKIEYLNQELFHASAKHDSEKQELNMRLNEALPRISELENTNLSLEEMLKAMNSQSQEKDEKILSLTDDYETRLHCLKEEHMNKEAELNNKMEDLQIKLSELEDTNNALKEESGKNLANLKNNYERRLAEFSLNDEELQSQLKMLTDKVSDTEQKLHDCIQNYEAQIDEHKAKLEQQSHLFNEEHEVLAAQALETTTQVKLQKEELQQTLDSKVSECEQMKQDVETSLKDKDNTIAKFTTLVEEKECSVKILEGNIAELKMKLESSLEAGARLEQENKDWEVKFKEESGKHSQELSSLEEKWQDKLKEFKQKVQVKIKELNLREQEKVKEVEDRLRKEREGNEEKVMHLESQLQGETAEKDAVASELAHANTKLLQLEQNKDTISELETKIVILQNKLEEKQGENDSINKENSGLHEKLNLLKSEMQVKNEEFQNLTSANTSSVEKLKIQLKSAEEELEKLTVILSENKTLHQKEKNDIENDCKKLQIELENARHTVLQSQNDIKVREKTIEELNGKLLSLENDYKEQLKEKDLVCSRMQDALESRSESLQHSENKLKELESEISILNETVSELKDFKVDHENKISQYVSKIEAKETENARFTEDVVLLRGQVEELHTVQRKLDNSLTENKTQNELIANLQNKIRGKEEEILTMCSRLDQLEIDKTILEETFQNQKQITTEKEHSIKNLGDEIEKLKEQLAAEKETCRQIEASIKEKQSDLENKQKAEMENLRSELESESAAKVAEFKKKAELYITQVKKQLQGENEKIVSELNLTVSELENEVSSLKEAMKDLTEANNRLQKEKETLQLEITSHKESNEKIAREQLQKADCDQTLLSELRAALDYEKSEKENLNKAIQELNQEKFSVTESHKNEVERHEREFEKLKIDKDEELDLLEKRLTADFEAFKLAQSKELEQRENEHSSKIKQLVKEFSQKLKEKEQEHEAACAEILERSNQIEESSHRENGQLLQEAQKEIRERDEKLDDLRMEYESKLKAKDSEMKQQADTLLNQITDLKERHEIELIEIQAKDSEMKQQADTLLNQITDLKQRHEIELIEIQAKMQETQAKKIKEKEIMHKEEVDNLTQEWHVERKSVAPLAAAPPGFGAYPQELLHHNQVTMDAVQSGLGKNDLGHQVIMLNKELEDLKEKHRLEIAELTGQREMKKSFLPQPLIAPPYGGGDGDQDHNLELINLDLQAQVNHLQGELARIKVREKELQSKTEDQRTHANSYGSPPSPGYFTDGTPSGPLLTEPTQLEYLRNILYMYMMGKETKTLARVIGTVVQFSEDQMKQLIAREERNAKLFGL